jgi:hypothetical protein
MSTLENSYRIPDGKVLSQQFKKVIDSEYADYEITRNLMYLAGRSMTSEQIYGACYLAVELAQFPDFQRFHHKPTLKSVTLELLSCLFEHPEIADAVWTFKDYMLAAPPIEFGYIMTMIQRGICEMILYYGGNATSQYYTASKDEAFEYTKLETYYNRDTNETLACRVCNQKASPDLRHDFDHFRRILTALEQFGNPRFRKIDVGMKITRQGFTYCSN